MSQELLLEKGKRYRARIQLGIFERSAPGVNAIIRERLEEAGFFQVKVWGDGATRFAEGVWPGLSGAVKLPEQIAEAAEVKDGQ